MNIRRIRAVALWTVTILGWAFLAIDPLPWGPDMADDTARLALTIAGCGSVTLAIRAYSRPAAEVYEMGVEHGRREQKITSVVGSVSRANVVQFRRRAQ